MTPELKHAIETIRDECKKHGDNCKGCVLDDPNYPTFRCRLYQCEIPEDWNPDEWEEEETK